MPTKIRVTHLGNAGRLNIKIIRRDVAGGEPHTLGTESELDPGESRVLAVYVDCAIVISRESSEPHT
jgi:hypothetical protein